jgi:glycosyltransferase involved in cell wall biosynthesis
VTKGCPARQEPGVENVHGFYGIEASFELVPLPRPAWRGGGLVYAGELRRFLGRERGAIDLAYCRDAVGAWLAARARVPFAFEAHVPPRGAWLRWLHARFVASPSCRGVVAISEALARHLRATLPFRSGLPLLVAPDAADPMPEADGAVPAPALGGERPRVGYVGQLYPGKGIELVLELARRTPEVPFHVIGGESAAIAALRRADLPANVVVHGFVPPAALPSYYGELDIVVLPYQKSVSGASGRSDLAPWMSPMKLFEAMAFGRAIVGSDLAALREILRHEETALLVSPDDIGAWQVALRRLAADPELRRRLGEAARRALEAHYTWDARAAKVLDGLESTAQRRAGERASRSGAQ